MKKERYARLALLGYFVLLVAAFVFTRMDSLVGYRQEMQWYLEYYGWLPHNYVPFQTIGLYLSQLPSTIALRNLFGNILVLLPFGVLLPWGFARFRRFGPFLGVCALFCVGLEVFQRLTLTGTFDVDDIILGFIGCLAGFLVFQGLYKMYHT
ncbi:VanZ family protein [Intestinibacillus sp. Marseille-P6563]|uniref:VanZ family protein n=1 Tax=Intestinibacillus sp. Marseille-P6563 TaxID=2364792 RepID=UPI000F05D0D5|nr:VanZ family protein [Intestinibacillus sp. Marseille-P6563]